MFDLSACHVERTTDQNYRVSWHSAQPIKEVAVYMTDNPEVFYQAGDIGAPLLRTTEHEFVLPNPDTHVRHYFYLESDLGDSVILAERQLPLDGSPNFRDLGGYETFDGRRLKWGRLFRSGKLSALTDTDLLRLKRLGLTVVCDFRQVLEQELEPSLLAGTAALEHASLPVTPGSLNSFIENLQGGVINVSDSAGLMRNINRELVAGQMPRYAEMFRLLLLKDQQILIHCASGKDRTGFGAALILDVLGVPEEKIIDDYLLTNKYLPLEQEIGRLSREFSDHTGAAVTEEILRPLMEVRPEYLAACFEEIRRRYQSKDHFFETALELDEDKIALLRERYLH